MQEPAAAADPVHGDEQRSASKMLFTCAAISRGPTFVDVNQMIPGLALSMEASNLSHCEANKIDQRGLLRGM